MEPKTRPIAGAEGLRLNLTEWSREGVPMLLLHGFGNEGRIWDDFAVKVMGYYRVLALDLRGHGDSDWHPEAAYEYDDYAADIEAIVDELEIERMVLVGHSLGGRISMLYAGRHPDKLAGLVIVDSAPELDRRGTTRISLDTAQQVDPTFASLADYEQMLVQAYPAATPSAIARMAQHSSRPLEGGRRGLKMDPALRGFVGGAQSMPSAEALAAREEKYRAGMWQALGRIDCPTLVVRGAASDVLSADIADRMVENELSQGRLAVVGRAGHSVMTDNPEGFNAAVEGFVLAED